MCSPVNEVPPLSLRAAAIAALAVMAASHGAVAEEPQVAVDDPASALTASQWRRLDGAVDRALAWIASQQEDDGSFRGPDHGQPAITRLGVMAFLSRGHVPGRGPYGGHLDNAVQYMLSCQHDGGLICRIRNVRRGARNDFASEPAIYNHAITALILSELYGMSDSDTNERIAGVIEKALALTRALQDTAGRQAIDKGGWRYWEYWTVDDHQADLSVTSWQLMFLRSARNAGFDVPSERIDRAMRFVRACRNEQSGRFMYHPTGDQVGGGGGPSRAMVGAGILALAHGGLFDVDEATRAGDWLLAHPYDRYNTRELDKNRFHYGLFYTVPAMYMLGGRYWRQFFPKATQLLLDHQHEDGYWQSAREQKSRQYGKVYTTALVVTALSTPNQLLPIFQR